MPRAQPLSTQSRHPHRPVVFTLLTDFGLGDSYVAEMKGVLLRGVPNAQMVDITHLIPPQDVLAGAIVLERAISAFSPGTIHLAVVDPGVGSDRRILRVELRGQTVLCPDNGLITWAWRRHANSVPPGRASEITWRPERASHTFHGRDIIAPAATMLATGQLAPQWLRPCANPVLLDIARATSLAEAIVIHVDHFGNVTTNIPADLIESGSVPTIRRGRITIFSLSRTYADVADGEVLALIGSSGLLEIAVRNGSAAKKLRLKPGVRILIDRVE